MLDTYELEQLKEANKALKEEKGALSLQVVGLKSKVEELQDQLQQRDKHPVDAWYASSWKDLGPSVGSSAPGTSASVNAPAGKRQVLSLISGPCIKLANDSATRCMAYSEDGHFLIVGCRLDSNPFYPFGLQKVRR